MMVPVLVIVDICSLIVDDVLLRCQVKLLCYNAFLIFRQLASIENLDTLKNLALMDTLICNFQFDSFIVHIVTSRNYLHYIRFRQIFKQKCVIAKSLSSPLKSLLSVLLSLQ